MSILFYVNIASMACSSSTEAMNLLLFTVFNCCLLTLSSEQQSGQCDVANIHVTHEDGREQVFRVKQLQPASIECQDCSQGSVSDVVTVHATTTARSPDLISSVTIFIGEIYDECGKKDGLPYGLCSAAMKPADLCTSDEQGVNTQAVQKYANVIVDKGLVPMKTRDKKMNRKIAHGIVLVNTGYFDEAVTHFTSIIKTNRNVAAAYLGRGVAYTKKGLQVESNAALALADFSRVIELEKNRYEGYSHRAEVYVTLSRHGEALTDIDAALKLQSNANMYYLQGIVFFITEDLANAEKSFRKSLELDVKPSLYVLYHLGLSLYYSGKVRNAVEVFRDAVKNNKDFVDGSTSLAQAYRELGNMDKARSTFNTSLKINPKHHLTLQLKGSMHYYSGQPAAALTDFKKCLSIEPNNKVCRYMQGLSQVAMGQFYEGIKTETKLIVQQQDLPTIKASPEFVKAQYLREYARYLHSHLETPLLDLNTDEDLSTQFKNGWSKMLSFQFEGYTEQPGLQPHISDVTAPPLSLYTTSVQQLLCRAHTIGWMSQVNADGYLPHSRLNLGMGLAAVHIAQVMENAFKNPRGLLHNEKPVGWRDIFNIAVQYRRLVDPEQPVLWLDKMPEIYLQDGFHRSHTNFIRGYYSNIRVMQYFDLVFKLTKTMVDHFAGNGIVSYPGFKEELQNAQTCEQLLEIAKKRKIHKQGLMVSTQVPSAKDSSNFKLDGIVITLTTDVHDRVMFSINLAASRSRTEDYHAELDFVFKKFTDEVRKTGLSKIVAADSVLNLILSLVYYFYNLSPLSRGSSVVAYTVAMGLLMSIGREVTGKIPPRKLVDLEAMLSGGPEAFILVTKQWMNIKKLGSSVSSLPIVEDNFPTIRNILEVLNIGPLKC